MKSIALFLAVLFIFAGAAMAAEPVRIEGSSLIESATYDAAARTLSIQMHNNTDVYIYQNVPQSVYDDFMTADSHGNFYVKNIKYVFESTRQE